MAENKAGTATRIEERWGGSWRRNGGLRRRAWSSGPLLGAGIALLYAPDRGEKTRKQLKRRLQSAPRGGGGRAGPGGRADAEGAGAPAAPAGGRARPRRRPHAGLLDVGPDYFRSAISFDRSAACRRYSGSMISRSGSAATSSSSALASGISLPVGVDLRQLEPVVDPPGIQLRRPSPCWRWPPPTTPCRRFPRRETSSRRSG